MLAKEEIEVLRKVLVSINRLERIFTSNPKVATRIFSRNPEKQNGLIDRSVWVEAFLEMRKLLKEERNSYKEAIKIIKKHDSGHKFGVDPDRIVSEFNNVLNSKENSLMRLQVGDEHLDLTNREAFNELESRFFVHTDGGKSKLQHIEADSILEYHHSQQVMSMIDSSGGLLKNIERMSQETLDAHYASKRI